MEQRWNEFSATEQLATTNELYLDAIITSWYE